MRDNEDLIQFATTFYNNHVLFSKKILFYNYLNKIIFVFARASPETRLFNANKQKTHDTNCICLQVVVPGRTCFQYIARNFIYRLK